MGLRAARGRKAGIFEKGPAFSGGARLVRPVWPGAEGAARQQSKFVLGFETNPKQEPIAGDAGTKGFDFNSSESLILAQNERWQRG